MYNIVILGPPGSGKGTQSKLIEERYNLLHLSTGDMLRREISEGTDTGKQVKGVIKSGNLVSDEIVTSLIASSIDCDVGHDGFLYDGYPRTVNQAKQLEDLLSHRNMTIDVLLVMEVEKGELVKRLSGRGVAAGRPDDQSIEVINNRLEIYRSITEPLVSHFCQKGICARIDGMGKIEEIFARIRGAIDKMCVRQ